VVSIDAAVERAEAIYQEAYAREWDLLDRGVVLGNRVVQAYRATLPAIAALEWALRAQSGELQVAAFSIFFFIF
jgi:hypothetical protein